MRQPLRLGERLTDAERDQIIERIRARAQAARAARSPIEIASTVAMLAR